MFMKQFIKYLFQILNLLEFGRTVKKIKETLH